MIRILLVEDDRQLNRTVCSFLNQNGFEATGCLSAYEAYDVMEEKMFDLIISDIMMPDIDGFEFAKTVRSLNQDIPILFMSARDDFTAKQRGYRIGIDDYLVKPVDLDEMLLKIGAILRRYRISNERHLTIGNLVLNTEELSASYQGEEIPLTVREFNILLKLLSNPRKTFTRSQLMDEFWSADTGSSSRTVDVYMAKIRDKFSECDEFEIVTVHGLGYKAVIHNE
ncbi:MAG: response regulator transcription factor [Erysipelotrichaceae bacterium]|nr:response regulator transcription factor [Erysipelotrichaceae bacterium]